MNSSVENIGYPVLPFHRNLGWEQTERKQIWWSLHDLNGFIKDSEEEDYFRRSRCLTAVLDTVKLEQGESDISSQKLLLAANILRNLAWYPGPNLSWTPSTAFTLMNQNQYLIREAAVGAVKNAAFFKGNHIPCIVDFVTFPWPEPTVRMRNDFVRTLDYVSDHSSELLHTESVKHLLQRSIQDSNNVTVTIAQLAFEKIFLE